MKPLQPIPSIGKKLNEQSTLPELPYHPEKFAVDQVHSNRGYIEARAASFGGLIKSAHLRFESRNVVGMGAPTKPANVPVPPKLPPRPVHIGKERCSDQFLISFDEIHQEKVSEKTSAAARRIAFLEKQQLFNRPPMAKNLGHFSKSESRLNT